MNSVVLLYKQSSVLNSTFFIKIGHAFVQVGGYLSNEIWLCQGHISGVDTPTLKSLCSQCVLMFFMYIKPWFLADSFMSSDTFSFTEMMRIILWVEDQNKHELGLLWGEEN